MRTQGEGTKPVTAREPGAWRRGISGLFPLWAWLFLLAVVAGLALDLPPGLSSLVALVCFGLCLVRPPRQDDREPVTVGSPVRGRWTLVHSPASSVPSHGVRAYAQSHAVDIIRPRAEGTAPSYPVLGGFERPATFASFGEPIHAVADGTVVRVVDGLRDHRSRSSWLAFAYMMVVDGLRDLGGPGAVIGNRVVIDHGDGVHSLYAHVRRGSARVAVGDRVVAGDVIGQIGNSGNTSEPHLHFQLMDRAVPLRAAGLPMRFADLEQPVGAFDRGWTRKDPEAEIQPGMPANFQVFEA